MNRGLCPCLIVVASVLLAAGGAGTPAGVGVLTLVPDLVEIGSFYDGTRVTATARVPRCDGVVLKLVSEEREVVVNRKGRFGPVWMNVAQVTVKGAPDVYILASSASAGSFCSAAARDSLEIGLDALRGKISFESHKPLVGDEFDRFLELKEHAGTYRDGLPLALTPAEDGALAVSAVIPLPSVMPPGDYTVRLYAFAGGEPVAESATMLTIRRGGLPRLQAGLARDHAAAYGVIAVLIAMLAGITTGVMFSSRSGARH